MDGDTEQSEKKLLKEFCNVSFTFFILDQGQTRFLSRSPNERKPFSNMRIILIHRI